MDAINLLEQVVQHYGLTIAIEPIAGGFIAFLQMVRNNTPYFVNSGHGRTIPAAILLLESHLASMDIQGTMEGVESLANTQRYRL